MEVPQDYLPEGQVRNRLETVMKRGIVVALCALLLTLGLAPMTAMAQGAQGVVIREQRVLQDGERIHEDLVILGGTLRVGEGSQVLGDIVVIGGEADIAGLIQGDIVGFGGMVQLGPTAEITGDVLVLGTLRRHSDAQVHGHVIEGLAATARLEGVRRHWPSRSTALQPRVTAFPEVSLRAPRGVLPALRTLMVMLGLVLIAALVASVLPRNLARTSEAMLRAAPLSLGVGLLTLLLTAFLVPLLVIICIGIPVALALLLALVAAAALAWVAAGRLVGQALLRLFRAERDMIVLETVVGTLLITLIAQIPCIGFLLVLVMGSWGLGAVMLTRAGTIEDSFWRPFGPSTTAPRSPSSPPRSSQYPSSAPPTGSTSGQGAAKDTRRLYP
jgi:hypothetical protein